MNCGGGKTIPPLLTRLSELPYGTSVTASAIEKKFTDRTG